MSWLQKCFKNLCRCCGAKPNATATHPPPNQPDKAPTDQEQKNDQQQQRQRMNPSNPLPLSKLEAGY